MKATRRTIEIRHPDGTEHRETSEEVSTSLWDVLFGRRDKGPRHVLNGDVWALEHRSFSGVRYETLRPATRRELIEHAHLNINPSTAPAILRGEVIA